MADGAPPIVCLPILIALLVFHGLLIAGNLIPHTASVVPYQGFKTADGDIFLGGANDRLFGILCKKLGKQPWSEDPRFITNNERVRNRKELEGLIEAETTKRTTQEWLEILEGSGLPYAAVNDVLDTLNHEHSRSTILK